MSPARKIFATKEKALEFRDKLVSEGLWAARVAQTAHGNYCVNAFLDNRKQFERYEFDVWV